MKAEHRHELKTNALADTLGRALHGIKTGPSRHTVTIGVALVVAVVVVVTGYFIWNGHREGTSALWGKLDVAQGSLDGAANPDELHKALTGFKDLSDQNPRSLAGTAARFDRARVLLHRGMERLYSPERDQALTDLKEARTLYDELSKDSSVRDAHPLLGAEALMGVAKADESLGDLDKALDGYKSLAKAYPKGPLHDEADKRAGYLDNADNRAKLRALYDKLDQQAKPSSLPEIPEKK